MAALTDLSPALERALRQELDARVEGETDPAEANRAAIKLAAEVRIFLEGQGRHQAALVEERQAAMEREPAFVKHLPDDTAAEMRDFLHS